MLEIDPDTEAAETNFYIITIGPSEFAEMRKLRELNCNTTHILGIEANHGSTHTIATAIGELRQKERTRYTIVCRNGWSALPDLTKKITDGNPIPLIIAFNSLGIAIHQLNSTTEQHRILTTFLEDVKSSLSENGRLIVSVGTGFLVLEKTGNHLILRENNCFEVEFWTLSSDPSHTTEKRSTNMWGIWIEALKNRQQSKSDVYFIDSNGEETNEPTPSITARHSSINYAKLVPNVRRGRDKRFSE
jgi:hypothetical protein